MQVKKALAAGALGLALAAGSWNGAAMAARPDQATGKAAADAVEAGERFYERAVKHAKARRWEQALELFEKALPFKNGTSDVFYNLVATAEQLKAWDKVHLYATGFLVLEPETEDAREMERKRRAAEKHLERMKRSPVAVSFDIASDGTTVMVDHVPVARSRGKATMLVPGRYTASASREDHHPWSQVIEVGEPPAQGAPVIIRGTLERMMFHGFVKVTTDPGEGVQVFQDDVLIGTTPLAEPLRLETRKYLFRFEKPGFDPWMRYVEVKRDETAELSPTLERSQTP